MSFYSNNSLHSHFATSPLKLQETTLSRTISGRVWKGICREIQVMRSQPVSESGFLGEFVSAASALQWSFSSTAQYLPGFSAMVKWWDFCINESGGDEHTNSCLVCTWDLLLLWVVANSCRKMSLPYLSIHWESTPSSVTAVLMAEQLRYQQVRSRGFICTSPS